MQSRLADFFERSIVLGGVKANVLRDDIVTPAAKSSFSSEKAHSLSSHLKMFVIDERRANWLFCD